MSPDEIKPAIRDYILTEFLPDAEPGELEDDTPLVTGGILDSISTTKLVAHLEGEFGVQFEAHEMGADYIDTVQMIADLIAEKKG